MLWSRQFCRAVSVFARDQTLISRNSIPPDIVKPDQITVTAPSNTHLPKYVDMGCNTSNNNDDVLPGGRFASDIVFVCVKPQILKNSLNSGKPFIKWSSGPLVVVSILAGIPLSDVMRAADGPGRIVYRIMTNTACALGAANCAIVREDGVDEPIADRKIHKLLSAFGYAEFMPESLMNAFSGTAGSGIAFVSC